jgi:hypothetical protein
MAFDWKGLVSNIAPALGTALGGPFAGMATKAIAAAITGDENTTEKDLAEAIQAANPDTLLKLKQADQAFEQRMAELGVDLEKIAQQDRASARAMQENNKSLIVPTLATITVGCFFAVVFWILSGKVSLDSTLLGFVLGQVSAKAEQVYNFFFGSSAGSKEKTQGLLKNVKP